MDRGCTIIFILLSISVYDLPFSSGEWIEVNGCHTLVSSAIQNQTSLPANEPGVCLQWCGTKTVALQNSTCLCINDSHHMNQKQMEIHCSQNCSGDEKLKCGGNSSDTVSVYRERKDVRTEWGSLNDSGCLTYSHMAGEVGANLVPDNCTVKHPFHCYSEILYAPGSCENSAKLDDKRTWYEALEACISPYHSYLWPAPNPDICNRVHIQPGSFWVAVYWWTMVIPTSTTSSTTSTTSRMLSTITMSRSTTSTTSITSSTLTTTEMLSQSTNSTMLSPVSISGTSSTTSATTSTTATTSSPSTSTRSPTTAPNNSMNKTFTDSQGSFTSNNPSASVSITALTNVPSMSTTSTSTKLMPTPGPHTLTNGSKTSSSETSSFKIDPPNIGLGIAIGGLAGFLISITIACCRRRICTRLFQRKRAFDNATYEIERL